MWFPLGWLCGHYRCVLQKVANTHTHISASMWHVNVIVIWVDSIAYSSHISTLTEQKIQLGAAMARRCLCATPKCSWLRRVGDLRTFFIFLQSFYCCFFRECLCFSAQTSTKAAKHIFLKMLQTVHGIHAWWVRSSKPAPQKCHSSWHWHKIFSAFEIFTVNNV